MSNERDEQVIFIKDLIFAALYQWRRILIGAIVAALLLGGLVVATGMTGTESTETEVSEKVQLLKDRVEYQQEYLDTSILMNLDPYHAAKATAQISVMTTPFPAEGGSQQASYVGALLSGYATRLTQYLGSKEASEALGLSSEHLIELASTFINIHGPADGTLTLNIFHRDMEGAQKILEQVLLTLPAITEDLTDAIAEHTLNTETFAGIWAEPDFAEQQKLAKETLEEVKATLAAEEGVETGATLKGLLKKAILFAVIGGILGAGLVACVIWVSHFSSTRVYSARTLAAWTGVKILGCGEGAPRKCALDRWLRKLEGRADADALPVAVAIAANYAGSGSFLICADEACAENVRKTFSEKIPNAKLCGSLTGDIAAVEALPGCECVLLVAVCGKTRYCDIARQVQLIRDQKKQLAGCILIDG